MRSRESRIKIAHHVLVRYLKNAKTLVLDDARFRRILRHFVIVTHAVDFDDQPGAVAEEVNDIWSNGMLTTKLDAADLAVAKLTRGVLPVEFRVCRNSRARPTMCFEA